MTEQPDHRLTGEQLDALLQAAGEDLLAHVQATGDMTGGLLSLMDSTSASDTSDAPDGADEGDEGDEALAVLEARVHTRDFLATVRRHASKIGIFGALEQYHRVAALIFAAGPDCADGLDGDPVGESRRLAEALGLALTIAGEFDGKISWKLSGAMAASHGFAGEVADLVDSEAGSSTASSTGSSTGSDTVGPSLRTHVKARLLGICSAIEDALGGVGIELVLRELLDAARRLPDTDGSAALRSAWGFEWTPLNGWGAWHPDATNIMDVYDTVSALQRRLLAIEVDASGLDLSTLDVGQGDVAMLVGVMWTGETRWPEAVSRLVLAHSRRIAEGVYQVVIGGSRDNAEASFIY